MKAIITILVCWCFVCCGYGQYHVRVESNPNNNGHTNPSWKNNYVIAYTLNNWQTKFFIYYQATYIGYDDNAVEYYTSYYERLTLQKIEDAVMIAKHLKYTKDVGEFESIQYGNHLQLKVRYDECIKKLCFGCRESKTATSQTVNIY
jgi:hypothetical protein